MASVGNLSDDRCEPEAVPFLIHLALQIVLAVRASEVMAVRIAQDLNDYVWADTGKAAESDHEITFLDGEKLGVGHRRVRSHFQKETARWFFPTGPRSVRQKLPASVVIARVGHIAIMVLILATIPGRVGARPMMIAVAVVVIAIPITYRDIAEVNADNSASRSRSGECRWDKNQRRGQNGPFERFHERLPFEMPFARVTGR